MARASRHRRAWRTLFLGAGLGDAMHAKTLLALALLATTALAGCTGESGVEVRFETNLGAFTVETLPEHAPVTVENFLAYVDEGFYDNLTFHRVSPGFVVQGGGFTYVDGDYEKVPPTRDPIVNEATIEEPNVQWSLSMARTPAPDSATSEFFVNLEDNTDCLDAERGRCDPSGVGYAVFAKVTSGFDTIEAMLDVPAGESFGSAGGYYPAEPIWIDQAYRLD